MTTLTHSVTEAVERFRLIAGAGDGTTTKCAMTALAWAVDESHTDSHPCVHPLLRSWVIAANDDAGTAEEDRKRLVLAGETGVIDTWWVPTEVIVWALSQVEREATPLGRALSVAATVAAWKETKERPDLTSADLTGADLTRADLTGANLTRANLTRAYLTGAYLTGADLTGANLTGANLTRAYLTGADLTGAYLTPANLTSADLTGADLTRAALTGANLTRANLTRAYLTGADLTGAYGNKRTALPVGWVVSKSGLIVRDAK